MNKNQEGHPNLIIPTSEQARINGSKGGKRSAEVRKERKTFKEELLLLLSDGKTQNKMCLAVTKKAKKGDIQAFTTIRDTVGEKPMDKVANMNFSKDLNINNEDVDRVIENIKDIAGF